MRIVVTTSKGGLDDEVYPFFGRCPGFTVAELERGKIIRVSTSLNPSFQTGGGAGIAAAQEAINLGAEAVITGNCGPNAMGVLTRAGIKVYTTTGTVKKALDAMLAKKLTRIGASNVAGHFGMKQTITKPEAKKEHRGGRK